MLFHECNIEPVTCTDVYVILILCRLSDDYLYVALVDKQNGKKESKKIYINWNYAEIKLILEVNEASQIHVFCTLNLTVCLMLCNIKFTCFIFKPI